MSHQTLIFSALPVRLTDRCPKATQRHHHRAAEANEADDGRDERGLYLRVHSLLPNRAAFIYCVPSSFVGTLFPTIVALPRIRGRPRRPPPRLLVCWILDLLPSPPRIGI